MDPNLVDLKPKEHYDTPSLRFRVLNDDEVAVSEKGARDTFVVEEEGTGPRNEVWRPEGLIPDPSVLSKVGGGGSRGGMVSWCVRVCMHTLRRGEIEER